jgi:hypothetical protein
MSKLENRVRQIEWPEPSEDLRARILETPVDAALVTWSDRIWFSRTWRVSIASAAVALIVIGQWAARGPAIQSSASITEQAQALEAAVIDAGIPADMASKMARRALVARQFAHRSPEQLLKMFGDQ